MSLAAPNDPAASLTRRFITPEGLDLGLRLGSASERAGAFMLDLMLIVAGLVVLTIIGLFIVGALGGKGGEVVGIIWLLGFFILRSFYFVLFEMAPRAATPGKRALGLRVVARDGGRLTGEAVFVRNAMREIEVFLPLTLLAGSAATRGDPVGAGMVLLGLLWSGIFLLFPLFNRDRLRVGDFVAGTWVVKLPRRSLSVDLVGEATERVHQFTFTADQAGAYGVKELQVLEDVLRRRDPKTLAAVAERIRAKILWRTTLEETDADFLAAYYASLRGRLEHRLLFGHRRKDKFDKA